MKIIVNVNCALTLPRLSCIITGVFQECSKKEGGDKKRHTLYPSQYNIVLADAFFVNIEAILLRGRKGKYLTNFHRSGSKYLHLSPTMR